jgi:tetratricopeptide (TPR) repeat protein
MPDSAALLAEGSRAEKLGMLDRALAAYAAAAGSDDPDVVSEALRRQSDVYRVQCNWETALVAARRAQQVARDAVLPLRYAEALNSEASVMLARGELGGARPLLEEMARVTDDTRLRGIALQNLGSVYAHEGDLDAAERVFAESYECFRECGYERGKAITLNNQGRAALDRGDLARATAILESAVREARDVEDEELIALTITNLGEATLAAGNYDRANDLVCTALGHFRTSDNRWREVECLRLLGTINDRRGSGNEAVRCYQRALRLAREIGARLEIAAISSELERLGAQPPPA